jgi:hypothetical protein
MTNNLDANPIIVEEFFSIIDFDGLAKFKAKLNLENTFEKALDYYIETWKPAPYQVTFEPGRYMSRDLSSIMYGDRPIIFLGSNHWACKRWLSHEEIAAYNGPYVNKIGEIKRQRDNNIAFIVVPEKDIVIDSLLGRQEQIATIKHATAQLRAAAGDTPFVSDELFSALPAWASADEYTYPDSHLLSRDYYILLNQALQGLGFEKFARAEIALESSDFYGDLKNKFDTPLEGEAAYLLPRARRGEGFITQSGSESFETPLSQTEQVFINKNAKFDASIQIFGDSHSSIFASKKITYMVASLFRETTFYWNPFGVRDFNIDMTADYVLMEISQRFVM